MEIRFDVYFKKNLGTLYKDNSITVLGKEANVGIDLKEVYNIYVNFRVEGESFTYLVEIVDVETKLIRIPFKIDVIKEGTHEFELVANMKNGDVLPSQTYSYKVDKSLENRNSIEIETNYPILIQLLRDVGNKMNDIDEAINKIPSKEELIGPQGPQGEQGIQGIQGPKGEQGEQGIQGPRGVQGEVGPKGPKGDIGPQGPKGDIGPKGNKGDKGDIGPVGPQGDKGDKGERGIQGEKGEKGDTPSITHLETTVSNKVNEIETRFNTLTSKQQQDAEVIDARVDFKGVTFNSLKERIDNTDKILRDSTVSTVVTESGFTTVEETSNGYFEDVKLEGKTLVNICEDIPFAYSAKYSIRQFKNWTMLKPSTEYTFALLGDFANARDVSIGDNNLTEVTLPKGNYGQVFTFITPSNINEFTKMQRIYVYKAQVDLTETQVLGWKVVILEGDHTQNPPSFFEGLKSVGDGVDEVSIVSSNENLLCTSTLEVGAFASQSPFSNLNGGEYDTQYRRIRIKLNRGTYVLKSNSQHQILCRCFYEGCTVLPFADSAIIHVKENNTLVKISFREKDNAVWTFGETTNDIKLILNKGDILQPYQIPMQNKKQLLYYNPTTQTWEKPILRQWDSIEKHSDGKYYYHKRSGEVVLNGSENWGTAGNTDTTSRFYFKINNAKQGDCICNLFKVLGKVPHDGAVEGCGLNTNSNNFYINILNSKLSTQNATGFKAWLQANNVTVVYQLAQEEVYECTNIDLITYENETNYIANTGAITPKSTLKVHNNISNVVKILQEKVSLLESNVKASQKVQDMMILETDMRMLDIELALMEFMPIKLNLGGSDMLRSVTYFNFLKNHIINETYEKEYLENVMNKYLATGRINQDEYDELYKMLYPPVYDIELPIEY